jgi:hypothetical protein
MLWDLWREPEDRGFAWESSSWAWMKVHPPVAALFMAYLAARLGRMPALDMVPITDQSDYFQPPAPGQAMDTAALFDQLRGVVLRDVLPAPSKPIDVRALAKFKEDNWDLLGEFRRYVERRLLACVQECDLELRRRMVTQLRDDLISGVDEIAGRLEAQHWGPGLGVLCTAVAAAPAVAETIITGDPFPASSAAVVPLAELVRQALTGGRVVPANEPLAFAALAQRAFS